MKGTEHSQAVAGKKHQLKQKEEEEGEKEPKYKEDEG